MYGLEDNLSPDMEVENQKNCSPLQYKIMFYGTVKDKHQIYCKIPLFTGDLLCVVRSLATLDYFSAFSSKVHTELEQNFWAGLRRLQR